MCRQFADGLAADAAGAAGAVNNNFPARKLKATHDFFRSEGFLYLQSPIITASDCEGAGEMFRVTTLPSKVCRPVKTVIYFGLNLFKAFPVCVCL